MAVEHRHGAGSGDGDSGGITNAHPSLSSPPHSSHQQHIHLQQQQQPRAPPEEELHQFALHAHYAQNQRLLAQQQQFQYEFEQQLQQQRQHFQLHGAGARYPLDVIAPAATTLLEVHHHQTTGNNGGTTATTGMQVNYNMHGKQVAVHTIQQQQQQQQHPQEPKTLAHSFVDVSTSDPIEPASLDDLAMHESLTPALLPATVGDAQALPPSAIDTPSDDISGAADALTEHLSPDEAPLPPLNSNHDSPAPPQLYKTSKMRRPELWQFIRLVVPDPPQLAVGKKYTNQDAKEAYCLKCKRMMHYNTGSSNNVSRHMAKFHPADLASYELKLSERKRNTNAQFNGDGVAVAAGRKRKLQRAHAAPGVNDTTADCVPLSVGHDHDEMGDGDMGDDMDELTADESDEPRKQLRTHSTQHRRGPGSVDSSSAASEQTIASSSITTAAMNNRSTADIISSVVETEKLNTLIAKWVCKHYHPFGITEDPEFQEIINFAINMKKSTTLPPQSEVRASVESLSARTRLDMLHQLASEAHFYSLATEIWTTTERDVFISFSVHYLTATFDVRHFTLDVREFNGHLSPEERKEQIDMILTRWNLDPRCMNTILWDSYNPPPRTNEFVLPHTVQTESVAHVVQCIMAPLLHAQRELSMDDTLPLFFVDEQVNALVGLLPPAFQHGVSYLREHVASFRDLAWFLTNHPRAVLWMSKFMAGSAQIRLVVDCKTNWLSTIDMLRRLMRKREVIRDFFAYLETTEGHAEFQTSGIYARAAPGPEQWCAIECLLLLLQPFESVAVALCKTKYASSCLALALLRFLQRDLEKASDFQRVFAHHVVGDDARSVEAKQKIAASLDVTRKFLHTRFMEHFAKLSDDLLWISQLDPRFVRMKLLDDTERMSCKTRLIDRCLGLTNFLQSQKDKALAAAAAHNHSNGNSTEAAANGLQQHHVLHPHHLHHLHESAASSSAAFLDFQTTKDDHDTNIFLRELLFDDNQEEAPLPHHQQHSQQQHPQDHQQYPYGQHAQLHNTIDHDSNLAIGDDASPTFEQQQEQLRQRIATEVDTYYQTAAAARVSTVRDPLQWWKESACRLPLLAPLARKWLAAVGSVRPTETLEIPHTGMAASLSLGGHNSAAAGHHHHHANGAAHHYVAVHCDPELVRDMVFVHDNC